MSAAPTWPYPKWLRDLHTTRDQHHQLVAAIRQEAAYATYKPGPLAGLVPSRVLLKLTEGNQP